MSEPKSRKKKIAEHLLRILVYGYAVALICVWLLIRWQGDHWWLATLLVYGPRWIYLAPLGLLVPAAMIIRVRSLVPLGLCGFLTLFSLMQLNVPWRSWGGSDVSDLRVLSYNIQRYSVPGEKFSALLDRRQPDVIAVQECAGVGSWKGWWKRHGEWHTVHRGELMVASRFPIKDVKVSYSRWPPQRKPVLIAVYCVLVTPNGELGFCNVHLDTPRRALSAVLDRDKIINLNKAEYADFRLECRRLESSELRDWLNGFRGPKIIAGDFNMTSDSPVYRRDWGPYRDAFVWAGWGLGRTKDTVIRRRHYGLRIDHILSDSNWMPVNAWVDSETGSDHWPLFAEFSRQTP